MISGELNSALPQYFAMQSLHGLDAELLRCKYVVYCILYCKM